MEFVISGNSFRNECGRGGFMEVVVENFLRYLEKFMTIKYLINTNNWAKSSY